MKKIDSNITCVLDASALMALINQEPGAEVVARKLSHSCISVVNFAEVLTKMLEYGIEIEKAKRALDNFNLCLIPFDDEQIEGTSLLRIATKQYGLSLADRVCLNLGKILNLPILTADQIWGKLPDPHLKIELIRDSNSKGPFNAT